ncbi:MAG: DoxX family protein [Deltaproteobacteria bacterium]|jgi:uncharacterized membrane protein YphA (DoxX/SURF4 family)|nr:DoxX family protein [Deltaproteobacteria bacterium]
MTINVNNKPLISAIFHNIWPIVARIALGATFLLSAFYKIKSPLDLATTISGYRILPDLLILPTAYFLPFLEFWSGLLILLGSSNFRRAASFLCFIMLIVFMAAALQGLIRGLDFDCGCFGSQSGRPGPLFFLRDFALLACAFEVLKSGGFRASKT